MGNVVAKRVRRLGRAVAGGGAEDAVPIGDQ